MSIRTVPDIDDRRTCAQCTQMPNGQCQAARSGAITASRTYEPDRTLLRRCEGYRPNVTDQDKRTGLQRWPGLQSIATPKTK